MGRVYEAYDPVLNRQVAVKTIRLEHLSDQRAEEFVARFRTEAHAAGRLKSSNIVSIYDAGRDEGTAFLVMELVEGEDLRKVLDRDGAMELESALRLMRELLAGLSVAHAHGIIHRDIKPSNLLLDTTGSLKIGDFGAARIVDTTDGNLTRGTVIGTLQYMSPEQLRGESIDHRSDLYAAGIVLYELLTGSKPFDGRSDFQIMEGVLKGPPPRATALRPVLPSAIDEVLSKALAKDPVDRFRSALEFDSALGQFRGERRRMPRSPSFTDRAADKVGDDETLIVRQGLGNRAREPARNVDTGPRAEDFILRETELLYWKEVRDSDESEDFEGFLSRFPHGIYADLARRRLRRIFNGGEITNPRGLPELLDRRDQQGHDGSQDLVHGMDPKTIGERETQLAEDKRKADEAAQRAEQQRLEREEAARAEAERAREAELAENQRKADKAARRAEQQRLEHKEAARAEAKLAREAELAKNKREAEEAAQRAEQQRLEREEAAHAEAKRAREAKFAENKRKADEAAQPAEQQRLEREEAARAEAERAREAEFAKNKRNADEAAQRAEQQRLEREEAARADAERAREAELAENKRKADEATQRAEQQRLRAAVDDAKRGIEVGPVRDRRRPAALVACLIAVCVIGFLLAAWFDEKSQSSPTGSGPDGSSPNVSKEPAEGGTVGTGATSPVIRVPPNPDSSGAVSGADGGPDKGTNRPLEGAAPGDPQSSRPMLGSKDERTDLDAATPTERQLSLEPQSSPREDAQQERRERGLTQGEQARKDRLQREQARREQAQLDQVMRERAQREQARREQVGREQAQREQAQREQAQREQAQREQAQREQAQREQAQREQLERANRERAERARLDATTAEKEEKERLERLGAKEKRDSDRILQNQQNRQKAPVIPSF